MTTTTRDRGCRKLHANIFLLVIGIITWRKSSQVYQNEPIYQKLIRDDFYWKIRRDEIHFNVDQRPLETAEVMNLSILTLTGGHRKPAR